MLHRCDSDSEWFPGKSYQEKRGPAPLLNASKRRAIATSMIAAKKRGHEPGVALAVRFCPSTTRNPETNAPFTPKYIRKVFREDCYDVNLDHPWKDRRRIQKTWLPRALHEQRLAWAQWELAHAKPPHPIFGSMMLVPIILTTLFIIPHWLKREDTTLKRILTFPLLVVQFWPQWQVLKVLKLIKERRTRKKK